MEVSAIYWGLEVAIKSIIVAYSRLLLRKRQNGSNWHGWRPEQTRNKVSSWNITQAMLDESAVRRAMYLTLSCKPPSAETRKVIFGFSQYFPMFSSASQCFPNVFPRGPVIKNTFPCDQLQFVSSIVLYIVGHEVIGIYYNVHYIIY